MNLSDFDYIYPQDLVAQHPLPTRDSSRMMMIDRAARTWKHSSVNQLPSLLRPGDVLVVNNSKVLAMRIFGNVHGGRPIELLFVEPVAQASDSQTRSNVWRCLTKKAKRIGVGTEIFFGMIAKAKVVGHEGLFLLVECAPDHLSRAMNRYGAPPLPPYIERDALASYSDEDRERYQTVYADIPGSAAAPTAGLHFSSDFMQTLVDYGVILAPVTLHVGIDTFRPVQTENIADHHMHGEHFEISESSAHIIMEAKKDQRRIIACGTTSVRVLESAAKEGVLAAGTGTTHLFITPGFSFQMVNGLITNFHQPKSTLIMMVSAFAGREFILQCYEEAIKERYRLFSYGDCMVIV